MATKIVLYIYIYILPRVFEWNHIPLYLVFISDRTRKQTQSWACASKGQCDYSRQENDEESKKHGTYIRADELQPPTDDG